MGRGEWVQNGAEEGDKQRQCPRPRDFNAQLMEEPRPDYTGTDQPSE